MHKFDLILLGGFHIEEIVYGPKYYYPGLNIAIREYEPDMPDDTLLVHLHAEPEVIQQRMRLKPHPHQLVQPDDVPVILEQFEKEVAKSWIKRKFAIDTSDLTDTQLLDTFMERSVPYLNERDMLTRMQ